MSSASDFEIDLNNLETEWAMLPKMYSEYSEQAEFYDCQERQTKILIEQKEAELSLEIRQNVKAYCISYCVDKITEGFINTIISASPEYQALCNKRAELERKKRLLSNAVRALEMKRDALKSLTALYQAEYFTVDQIKSKNANIKNEYNTFDTRAVVDEVEDRYNRTVAENADVSPVQTQKENLPDTVQQDNVCPYGYEFGKDDYTKKECDKCEKLDACIEADNMIQKQK